MTSEQRPRDSPEDSDISGAALIRDGFDVPSLGADQEAPPAYGDLMDQLHFSQTGIDAGASVTDDGRININIKQKSRQLSDLLATSLSQQALLDSKLAAAPLPPAYISPSLGGQAGQTPPPKLSVVIQIVGSRGDVQPFVALGKVLKETYGHRVRVATHPTFRNFVEENGLEFFSIGGDPAELMAFMVKNPGLMPGFDAIKSGEISKRRKGIEEIVLGCWRSCIESGNGLGPQEETFQVEAPLDLTGELAATSAKPFIADAIIANPPSFAHIHVAEKLGIPLHMMFTMPWSPTKAFPHPLANIQSTNTDDAMTNYVSYALVEMLTWQGLGDVINRFRTSVLDLEPLSLVWAPGLLTRLKIPYTYCWSPALIPKPNDWANHIDISGFYFLNLASSFTPEPELAAFLAAGPPPVYIGFGSIVVDDPNALTRLIFDAVHLTGVRALVSKGWGGLGAEAVGLPDGVFMLGNVPHDWLFQHVSAVVHHGGAGTTAAGIHAGKPTVVVPFFGDQPFWGSMVQRAGAGPAPIHNKSLTANKLAEAIKFCLKPETQQKAKQMGQRIREEKGTDVGGKSFHDHLNVEALRCTIAPSRVAVWRVRRTKIRLSGFAATVLVKEGLLKYTDLKLYRPKEYDTEDQPWDPISACTASLVMDASSFAMAIADFPREIFKSAKKKKKEEEAAKDGQREPTAGNDKSSASPTDSASQSMADLPEEPLGKSSQASITATDTRSTASVVETASSTQLTEVSAQPSTPERPSSVKPQLASPKDEDPGEVTLEKLMEAGKGASRVMSPFAKSPMNFCMSLARGFRNAPKLYNDDTVRPSEKVTDMTSGLRIAGKEFGLGLYDGITGLVTQPVRGAVKDGPVGLLKGFGKGIGGFVLKTSAASVAIPAYTMKGIHMSVRNAFAKSIFNHVTKARILEGMDQFQSSSKGERKDVVARWNAMNTDLKSFYSLKMKEKKEADAAAKREAAWEAATGQGPPKTGWKHTWNMTFDERKKLHAEKEKWNKAQVGIPVPDLAGRGPTSDEQDDIEQAIQTSVRETSQGNPEEDARVEQALRASVQRLRRPSMSQVEPEELGLEISDAEFQALIDRALQQSMKQGPTQPPPQEDENEDEDLQRAIEESRRAQARENEKTLQGDPELLRALEESKARAAAGHHSQAEEEELRRAMEASATAHAEEMARQQTASREEDVVMEYVKKQSLAEEEYRKRAKGKMLQGEDVDEDEELRRAMEESLKPGNTGVGYRSASGPGPSKA